MSNDRMIDLYDPTSVYRNVLHPTSIYQELDPKVTVYMTSQNESVDNSCNTIKQIIKILNTTIPLIWLIVGTLTNGLSLFVFSRPTLRNSSTFFYIAIMTLSDFIVIWTSSFRDFLAYRFQIYIKGSFMCRLHVFLFYLTCQFSSWLLTAANFDRLVFVISHKHSKIWCTKRTAIKVTSGIFILLVLINFHVLIFVNSVEDLNIINNTLNETSIIISQLPSVNKIVYPYCILKQNGYDEFFSNYYSWIDAFVYSYIPFVLIFICNVALIKKVFSSKKNINRRKTAKQKEIIANDSKEQNQVKSVLLQNNQANQNVKSSGQSESIDRIRNMAITVIGVAFLFIIFTLPINIYVPIVSSSSHDSNENHCDDILFCILNNMVNANHAINFFIYFATNSKFKKEICEVFKFKSIRSLIADYFNRCWNSSRKTNAMAKNDINKKHGKHLPVQSDASNIETSINSSYKEIELKKLNNKNDLNEEEILVVSKENDQNLLAKSSNN